MVNTPPTFHRIFKTNIREEENAQAQLSILKHNVNTQGRYAVPDAVRTNHQEASSNERRFYNNRSVKIKNRKFNIIQNNSTNVLNDITNILCRFGKCSGLCNEQYDLKQGVCHDNHIFTACLCMSLATSNLQKMSRSTVIKRAVPAFLLPRCKWTLCLTDCSEIKIEESPKYGPRTAAEIR